MHNNITLHTYIITQWTIQVNTALSLSLYLVSLSTGSERSVTQTLVIKTVGVRFGEGVGGDLGFLLLVVVLAILVTLPVMSTLPVHSHPV